MQQVKAVLVTDFGGYNCLRVEDRILPSLTEEDVEVKVYYCGLNFADLYTRQGLMPNRELPFVLGMECTGVVTRVGKGVTDKYKVGQHVVCYNHLGGMFQYKIIIPYTKCYVIPNTICLKEAAALTVNYLTAYFSLMELGNLKPNQHVLINSCAGGVGWAATQLASLIDGVVVYGTTSSEKTMHAKNNGVNYVLSYENLQEQIKMFCPEGLDLIIDNQAGTNHEEKQAMLKEFGRLVVIGSNDIIRDENRIAIESLGNINAHVQLTSLIMGNIAVSGLHLGLLSNSRPDLFQDKLNKILDLLSERRIKPKIDSVWHFEEIIEATKLLQERKNIGKVLLTTGQDKPGQKE